VQKNDCVREKEAMATREKRVFSTEHVRKEIISREYYFVFMKTEMVTAIDNQKK